MAALQFKQFIVITEITNACKIKTMKWILMNYSIDKYAMIG